MKQQGFTLIELLIALAIFSLAIAIALPSFKDTIAKHQLRSSGTEIYRILAVARSYAISLNRVTTICPSVDQQQCLTDRNWSEKYILIFVDNNFDGEHDAEEEILTEFIRIRNEILVDFFRFYQLKIKSN